MKLNIAVLFGHLSCEHDISIITACQAMRNLDKNKYNIIPIYITKDNKYITDEKLLLISNYPNNIKGTEVCFLPNSKYLYKKNMFGLKKYKQIDVALFCFHGHLGEDGAMQGLFELNDIPYTSTDIIGSVCGSNKIIFKEILKGIDVPQVSSIWVRDSEFYLRKEKLLKYIIKKLNLPVIVKPNTLGSSIGITVANNEYELSNSLSLAFELDERVLIEKFVSDFKEINIATLFDGSKYIFSDLEEAIKNDKILTFENKYIGGSKTKNADKKIVPTQTYLNGNLKAKLTRSQNFKIKMYTKKVYDILNLKGVVRFDYIVTNSDIYLNEINTIPGSLANYLFKNKGLNYSKLLDELINSAIVNNSKKQNYIHTFNSSVLKSNATLNGIKK